MSTLAATTTRWAAQQIENHYASAIISGIVPDQAHRRGGGYHVSIQDLATHGNAGDYSNRRPGDKAPPVTPPGRKFAAAFDISMSPADMRRVHRAVMKVFADKTDPRRRYINAINCWDGSGEAVRVDFQANTVGWATADHRWHVHADNPRQYTDVARDSKAAWKAARAVVSAINGQGKAAWLAAEAPRPAKPKPAGDDAMVMSEEGRAAVRDAVLAALETTRPYHAGGPRGRLKDPKLNPPKGWGDLSGRGLLEYLFDGHTQVMRELAAAKQRETDILDALARIGRLLAADPPG